MISLDIDLLHFLSIEEYLLTSDIVERANLLPIFINISVKFVPGVSIGRQNLNDSLLTVLVERLKVDERTRNFIEQRIWNGWLQLLLHSESSWI